MTDPSEYASEYTPEDVVVLAREAAAVLRAFYDDVTPCIHRLRTGERCALCGRARALLVECDALNDTTSQSRSSVGRIGYSENLRVFDVPAATEDEP